MHSLNNQLDMFQDRILIIVLWCNGSTTVFGSVSGGSNPPGTTEAAGEVIRLPLLLYIYVILLQSKSL